MQSLKVNPRILFGNSTNKYRFRTTVKNKCFKIEDNLIADYC